MGGDGLNNVQVRGDFNYVVRVAYWLHRQLRPYTEMQDIWWFLSEISQPTSSYEPSCKLLHKIHLIAGVKGEVISLPISNQTKMK
jgi:hypothetical protein